MLRVHVLVATVVLALAVSSAEASRGLRAQVETKDLTFSDLHDNAYSAVSFDTLAAAASSSSSTDGASPASVREVQVDSSAASSSSSSSSAASSLLNYTRPTTATFFDLVGDLSTKWISFSDNVAVSSGAKTNVAASCDATTNLNACLEACATNCFANNACQWFTLQPATKDCILYRSLHPVAGDAFAAVPPNKQLIGGYIKAAVPALLSAKATCTKTVVYNGNDSFCVAADGSATYYLAPPPATSTTKTTQQCASSPLTLLRTFQNNFFNKGTDTSMTEELASGKLKNAKAMAPAQVGGDFTMDTFLQLIKGDAPFVVSTDDLTVDAQRNQLIETGTKTQWTYTFDAHGRVVSVASTLAKKNLLFTKDATTGKMVTRKDFGKPQLESRFSYSIHARSAVQAVKPPSPLGSFSGGEIASSLFTSPNGFWNLVPQSDNSRLTGCWKQANDAVAKLLEWGFAGEWAAQLSYFDNVETVKTQATKAAIASHELLTEDDIDKYYSSTGSAVGDLAFQVDFPCAYFYRPFSMKQSFTLTGCDMTNGYCAAAWPAIQKMQKSTKGSFFTVAQDGTIEISRAMAHWAFENTDGGAKSKAPLFTYLKALATASEGLCFTETGKSLQKVALQSQLRGVVLVTSDGECVALSSSDGSPSLTSCGGADTNDSKLRYNVDAGSQPQKCITGTGESCPTFAFAKPMDSNAQAMLSLETRDELVAGTLSFGSKGCLVVDGDEISFSTDPTSCSPVLAAYVASTKMAARAGDPVDPEGATEKVATANKVPTERIDDPDPELY